MPRSVNKRAISAAVISGAFVLTAAVSGCSSGDSTASLVSEAKQYQQKGDNKAALIQLKNAVAKSPEDAEVRLLLAKLYIETGDVVSADKELRKARELGATADKVMLPLAKVMLAQGQFQKVLDETAASAAKTPELATVRGEAFLGLNQPEKAKATLDEAIATHPADAGLLIALARHAMTQKDPAAASGYIDRAVAADPKNADALMFKGALLNSQGKFDAALATFDQALAIKPDHRSAHLEKAYIEIQTNKYDAAKADIAAAQKATPNNLLVLYTQGLLDYSQGKDAAALESVQKVLRGAPEHMPTLLLAASIEARMGAAQQAEQHLRKYLESNPGNLFARKMLAGELLKARRAPDAVAVLAPVMKDGSKDPQLLALSGEAAMQSGQYKQATGYFEEASTLAPNAAVLHTSLGLSKLGQGDGTEAERELELAASLDTKSPKAGFTLVLAEMRLKHYDKALAAVSVLEKTMPTDPSVQNLKGGVYLAKNDYTNARASFEKAIAVAPDYLPATRNLAQLDLYQKHPEDAKKRYEALLAKNKKSLPAMFALADLALSQGKPEEATSWLERASNESPDALPPAIRLGVHYLRLGQNQKALALAQKFQAANPANPDLLDILGRAQLATGDKAGALQSYSTLAGALPKSPLAHFRLAEVHMLMKNEVAATEDLKKALSIKPDFAQAQLAQLELAQNKGNTEQALAIARTMQKQHPEAPIGHVLEGDLLLWQHKAEPALAKYEQAFALKKSTPLMLKIHNLLLMTGKEKQADQRLAEWRKDHPQDSQVGVYLAEASIAKKQYKAAIPELEAALKQNPGNVGAMNNLAWVYQQEKDPRALATAEKASSLAPNSPEVMDTLGWMLVEQGNVKRGLPILQKAAELAPGAPEIHFHLASALTKSGDKANARKELESLLAKGDKFQHADEARALLKQL